MTPVNKQVCDRLKGKGEFRPIHCSLCSKQRATCPNWQKWLESSQEVEIPLIDRPDSERDIVETEIKS